MSGTETAAPTGTFSDHFRWPSVWRYAGAGWYGDAIERGPADVTSLGARRAANELRKMVQQRPNELWDRAYVERELGRKHAISSATAKRLLDTCPGSASPAGWDIWGSTTAAADWSAFRAGEPAA